MDIRYTRLSDIVNRKQDIDEYIIKIIRLTIDAKEEYPDYLNWFMNKHVPGIYLGNRDTIMMWVNDELIGVSNIKKSEYEIKICTLFIKRCFRKNKLGLLLVEESMKYLECDKPIITMSQDNLSQFKNVIKRYDWKLTDVIKDCYKDNVNELVFNGGIIKTSETIESISTENKIKALHIYRIIILFRKILYKEKTSSNY